MRISRRNLLQATGLGIASAAFGGQQWRRTPRAQAADRLSSDQLDSEVAWRWFELLYDIVKSERIAPPQASRIYGLAAVVLYESVVAGSATLRSLVRQLNELKTLPSATDDAYWPESANAALAHAIRSLFPAISRESRSSVAALESLLSQQATEATSPSVAAASGSYGRSVAMALLDWSQGDNSAKNALMGFVPSQRAGAWRPTPPAFNPSPLAPGWGLNRPMALASGEEGAPSGRPAFSVNPASGFYTSAVEVYETGQGLTPDQKATADYWADNPGATGTPPGHWMAIVSQISRNDRLPLSVAAEAYARAGIAVHDAFICCWNVKYGHDLMRPVTYVNDYIDPGWMPYIVTPNFPTYTSGHSTQSGAVATVLADMFGKKRFQDTSHVDHGLRPVMDARTFSSFEEAAAEAAVSRLYGGIHYVFDNQDGLVSGQRLGQTILSRIKFRAISA